MSMDIGSLQALGSAAQDNRRAPRGVELQGIWVEFPFEPYDCQREYMNKVLTALREGNNALLESPTGTGKTLCLLCSTLAWRESLKGGSVPPVQPNGSSVPAASDALNASGRVLGSTAAPSQSMSSGLGSGDVSAPAGSTGPAASSGPGGASSSAMPEALVSMLAAQAGAARGAAATGLSGDSGRSELPVIIYSSRTHSQLAQVVRELRGTSYRDRVRSTVLGSRQQMCIHPKVSAMNGTQANLACKSLVNHKKCGWYNGVKFGKKDWVAPTAASVPDIEDLVSLGRSQSMCPFYMSRELSKEADIVFMPYNYLLDANTRKALMEQVRWDNAVMIFDEAHNVEGVCSDASSFEISAKNLADAMNETRRCRDVCMEQIERGNYADAEGGAASMPVNFRQLASDLELLQRVLKLMENGLQALADKLPQDGLTRPGAFLFQFLADFNIRDSTLSIINSTIDVATEVLQASDMEAGQSASNTRAHTVALQHLQNCLNLAFSTLDPISDAKDAPPAHKGYRVHVRMERVWGQDKLPAPTLCYWCFIPGMAFRMLRHLRLRSILLTSGTLAPLESFAHELQMRFDIRLQNPHIISPSQVWVGVLSLGPSGHTLNSSFQHRDDTRYKDDLGNAIVNFARTIPDGLLVFFPSYKVLDICLEHWKGRGAEGPSGSIWERITRYKAPVVEPRDSSLFPQAIEDYKTKLDNPAGGGAVMFAVCRGKVSEGLDFSDKAGRGVIITGIPFAMKTDPKVRIKREVLDEDVKLGRAGLMGGGLTGEQWYVQQAMRAVNQAMGRVIRHRWDYGAIILADKRFGDHAPLKQMSHWLQEYIVKYDNFGQAAGSLAKFFKDKVGFSAPASYAAAKAKASAGGAGAFEVLGGSTAPRSGRSDAQGQRPRLVSELAPAAVDISGLLGFGGAPARGAAGLGDRNQQGPSFAGGSSRLAALLESAGNDRRTVKDSEQSAAPAKGAQAGERDKGQGLGEGRSLLTLAGAAARRPPPARTPILPAYDESVSVQHAPAFRGSGLGMGIDRGAGDTGPSGMKGGGGGSEGGEREADGCEASDLLNWLVDPLKAAAAERAAAGKQPAKADGAAERTAGADVATNAGGGRQAADTELSGWSHRREEPGVLSHGGGSGLVEGPHAHETSGTVTDRATGSAAPKQPGAGPADLAGGTEAARGESSAPELVIKSEAASGPPGGAASAGRQGTQQFMDQLQSALPEGVFKQVRALLLQYRKEKDPHAFIEGIVQLLKGPATVRVLQWFVPILPKKERSWFSEVVATHMAAAPHDQGQPQLHTQGREGRSVGSAAADHRGPSAFSSKQPDAHPASPLLHQGVPASTSGGGAAPSASGVVTAQARLGLSSAGGPGGAAAPKESAGSGSRTAGNAAAAGSRPTPRVNSDAEAPVSGSAGVRLGASGNDAARKPACHTPITGARMGLGAGTMHAVASSSAPGPTEKSRAAGAGMTPPSSSHGGRPGQGLGKDTATPSGGRPGTSTGGSERPSTIARGTQGRMLGSNSNSVQLGVAARANSNSVQLGVAARGERTIQTSGMAGPQAGPSGQRQPSPQGADGGARQGLKGLGGTASAAGGRPGQSQGASVLGVKQQGLVTGGLGTKPSPAQGPKNPGTKQGQGGPSMKQSQGTGMLPGPKSMPGSGQAPGGAASMPEAGGSSASRAVASKRPTPCDTGAGTAGAEPRTGLSSGTGARAAASAEMAGAGKSKPAAAGATGGALNVVNGEPQAKRTRLIGPAGTACPLCSKCPIDQPFEAPCGHMACYGCWVKQVMQHMACAVCKKPVRKGQLIKRHFVS